MLECNTWNHLTECKQMTSGWFEILPIHLLTISIQYMHIYIYKQDLAWNDLQGLILRKTSQPTTQSCLVLYTFCAFSRTDFCLYTYHLIVWSKFNFLLNSQWITFPTRSCLVLYTFCASLLQSLIIWLTVLSLFPYNLHFEWQQISPSLRKSL